MSPGASADAAWYAVALVYVAEEPIRAAGRLHAVLRETTSPLGREPASVYPVSARGKVGRARVFSESNVDLLLSKPETGAVRMLGLKQSRAYFDFRWYLRHNPSVEMKYQPPGVLYCIAECGPQALSSTQVVEAAKRFVVACATEMTVLHGGITALPNRNQALAEASLVGVDVAREPESYVRRWSYDAGNQMALWQRARHVYWTTLLGPHLVRQVDPAARCDAVDVTEVCGSLIVRTTDSIQDSLQSGFSVQTRRLRQWLWPYLIQNPEEAPV